MEKQADYPRTCGVDAGIGRDLSLRTACREHNVRVVAASGQDTSADRRRRRCCTRATQCDTLYYVYRVIGGITYLTGVVLIVGAALLAVASILQLSSVLANPGADFGAVVILGATGLLMLYMGN